MYKKTKKLDFTKRLKSFCFTKRQKKSTLLYKKDSALQKYSTLLKDGEKKRE